MLSMLMNGLEEDDEWKVVQTKHQEAAHHPVEVSQSDIGMDTSTAVGSAQGDLIAMASSSSIFGNFSMLGLTMNQDEDHDDSYGDLAEEEAKDLRDRLEIAEDLKNHKTVFVNQRWQRENDMRDKIRHLAEYGEKMVQKEREVDYREDFEETDSNDSQLEYLDDSDEEFSAIKSQVLEMSR